MRVMDTFLSQNVLAFVTVRVCVCAYAAKRESVCVCVLMCVCISTCPRVPTMRYQDSKEKNKERKLEVSSAATVYKCLNQIIAQAATDCIVEEAAHNIRCHFNRFLQGFHTMCLGACHFQLETTVKENTNTSAAYYVSCSFSVWKTVHQKTREPGSIREKECRRSISGLLVLL